MKIIYFLLILLIFCIILTFLKHFSQNKLIFCDNFKNLKNLYLNKNIKFSYIPLTKSNLYFQLKYIKNFDNSLFCETDLKRDFNKILSISKYIDYKINNCKNTFRSKKNIIIIDRIANILVSNLINNNKCNIFYSYNLLSNDYLIRHKENKIFKFLIAKYLLLLLLKIKKSLNNISDVIYFSKSTPSLLKYKNKILNLAQTYGVEKFNKNSTQIFSNYNKNEMVEQIKNFLNILFEIELKIKIILGYINILFN